MGWSDEELEALQQDGWASDIDDPASDGEHMDAIKARIVVELDAENKDKVIDAINDYCESNEVAIEIK